MSVSKAEIVDIKKRLLDAHDLQTFYNFSRSMSYDLLNNPSCPVVQIGKRRFMITQEFEAWLRTQAVNANQ